MGRGYCPTPSGVGWQWQNRRSSPSHFAHPRLIPVIRMGAPFNASSALDTKGSSSRIVLFVRGVHSRFPSTVCRTRYEFFMIFSIPNSTQDSGVQ